MNKQLDFEKKKIFDVNKINDFSDNLYVLNGTNTYACPLGIFCQGKGNIDKSGKKLKHESLNFCPMWNLIKLQEKKSDGFAVKRYLNLRWLISDLHIFLKINTFLKYIFNVVFFNVYFTNFKINTFLMYNVDTI